MNEKAKEILESYKKKYFFIAEKEKQITEAYHIINDSYYNGGKLLICGNGGSNSDADHIAGELLKGFNKMRSLSLEEKNFLNQCGEIGEDLAEKLQGSLPAINLGAHTSLVTAVINDIGGEEIFAQQVIGFGNKGDVLLGISTSGNSKNVLKAIWAAKMKGMKTIGLMGDRKGKMLEYCDAAIEVPSLCTPDIQDMHTSVYHVLCAMLEAERWEN